MATYKTDATGKSVDLTGLGKKFENFVRRVGFAKDSLKVVEWKKRLDNGEIVLEEEDYSEQRHASSEEQGHGCGLSARATTLRLVV